MTATTLAGPTPRSTAADHPNHSRRHWPALDGVRALAIGLVVVGHYAGSDAIALEGVQVFLVLSGFLITGLILDEYALTDAFRWRRFYARRALRIFPAYYGFLAVSYWLATRGHLPVAPGRWLGALTYTSNYVQALQTGHPGPLMHLWSLAVEEQFYLLWPGALVLLLPRLSLRRIAQGLAAVVAMVLLWRLAWLHVLHGPLAYIRFAFDARADMLATGCLLAVLVRLPSWPRVARWLRLRLWVLPLAILLLAVLTWTVTRAQRYGISFTLDALLIGLILAGLTINAPAPRHGWRWLDHPALRRLGTWSYSLYLYHLWGWAIAASMAAAFPIAWLSTRWGNALLGVPIGLMLAVVSYAWVERPILRWRDRVLPR